jgi:hypothetical protein
MQNHLEMKTRKTWKTGTLIKKDKEEQSMHYNFKTPITKQAKCTWLQTTPVCFDFATKHGLGA